MTRKRGRMRRKLTRVREDTCFILADNSTSQSSFPLHTYISISKLGVSSYLQASFNCHEEVVKFFSCIFCTLQQTSRAPSSCCQPVTSVYCFKFPDNGQTDSYVLFLAIFFAALRPFCFDLFEMLRTCSSYEAIHRLFTLLRSLL